jgi:hypothetical protein
VKQKCESKQFIAINDKLKMDSRVFISNIRNGEESKTVRDREGEGVRDREGEGVRDRA